VVISQYSVGRERVNRAFLVFYFGIAAIAIGTVLLSAAEEFALEQLLFEAVSAFGTVGLSTGITGELSTPGRIIIILLMYIGRVGPLTILAAASRPSKGLDISYPRGDILL
jgi:trk system potassium uptake protein TrkH